MIKYSPLTADNSLSFTRLVRATAILFLLASCAREPDRLETGPVDLGHWTAVNYRLVRDDQQYANWVVSDDKQSVTQMENADPAIFLSDRNLDRQTVEGTWLVDGGGDDDLIGFVFGYRDPGHFYVFDWKKDNQDEAKRGMSLKIVAAAYEGAASGKLPPGKPFEEHELWATDGISAKVRLLHYEDTPGWEFKRPYTFRLDFRAGEFRVVVKDGAKTLYDRTYRDDTYPSGRFGFYNYSQGPVVYKGFETRMQPGVAGFPLWIPIIAALLLALLISAVIMGRRHRWRTGRLASSQPTRDELPRR
jgi:hypothetical protein